MRLFLILALVLVGFSSIVSQTLIIRELIMVFSGNELSLGVIFAGWLFWVAIGSFGLGRFCDNLKNKLRFFIITQVLVSFVLLIEVIGVRSIRFFLHIPPGELISLPIIFYSSIIILAPLCLIFGFQFALGCRLYAELMRQEGAYAISRVYILDALGDMCGGFAFGYIFIHLFHSLQIVIFIAIVNLLIAFALSTYEFRSKHTKPSLLCGVAILVFLLCSFILILSPHLERLNNATYALNWKNLELLEVKNSKYNNFVVTREGSLYNLYANGQLISTYPNKMATEELIHFPLLQVPHPQRVLIVGGASTGAITELLKYPLRRIDYVELDPLLIEVTKTYLEAQDVEALENPRLNVIHTDGRLFIKNYAGKNYDAVIVNLGSPHTATLNRFYTQEFFRRTASILKEEGVIFFAIDSDENYLGRQMQDFNGSIYRTLKEVFPYIVLTPGETMFITASQSNRYISDNAATLAQRLAKLNIKTKFVNAYTLPYRFYPERMSYIKSMLVGEDFRLNYDFHPIGYIYNILLWQSRFQSKLVVFFSHILKLKWHYFLLLLFSGAAILLFSKRRLRERVIPLIVLNTGFAGLSLELILIIGFQILYGYLYHLIGIIIASFMLGLCLGAQIATRYAKSGEKARLSHGQFLFAIYALSLPLMFMGLTFLRGNFTGLAVQVLFPLLTLIDGLFVGFVFPLANQILLGEAKPLTEAKPRSGIGRTVGLLYACDLIGACGGALIITILIIPIFGIFKACLLVGLLNLLSFFLTK